MKIKTLLLLLPVATIASLQAQNALENFQSYTVGNNLTTPLGGGTGWTGNWVTTAAGTFTPVGTVSNTTPLAAGADQYLATTLTDGTAGNAMGIGRQLSTGAPTTNYTVSFLWRADAVGAGFTNANDRFEFYSSNSATTVNTGGLGGNVTTSPYLMGIFGAARGTGYTTGGLFGVYSPTAVNEAFDANHYFNLGSVGTTNSGNSLTLTAGDNYAFTLNINVTAQTWDVSVIDTTTNVTAFSNGLKWWGNTTQSYVAFGARGSAANETRSFSFDNVQLTAVPEPNSVALAIVLGGLLPIILIRRRSRRF